MPITVESVEPAIKQWNVKDDSGAIIGDVKIENVGSVGEERVTLNKGTASKGSIVFASENEIAGIFEGIAADLRADGK